jgi:hypothetical protein
MNSLLKTALLTLMALPFSSQADVKLTRVKLPEGEILFDPILEPLIKKVAETGPSRILLNQALSSGPIAILESAQETSWNAKYREMQISSHNNPARGLKALLFEISNSLQNKRHLALFEDCNAGIVGREAYVERSERIEYDVIQVFAKTVGECISKYGWPKEADVKSNIPRDKPWEEYWEITRTSRHADHYRKFWDQRIKPTFCSKNPNEAECLHCSLGQEFFPRI